MVEHEPSAPIGRSLPDPNRPDPAAAVEAPVEGDDAALERIWKDMGGSQDDVPFQRDEPVESTTEPEPEREPAEAPWEPRKEVEPESERAPAPSTAEDSAYRLALVTLRQDGGWTTEDLALLPPERVIAIADHRGRNQQRVEQEFATNRQLRQEIEVLRKNLGSGSPPGGKTGSEEKAEATAAGDVGTGGVDVSKIADRLALDEEGARELADFIRGSQAPLLKELGALKQGLSASQRMAMQAAAETARRDLAERFPQVRDPKSDEFRRVAARMGRLQREGSYSSVHELMEDSILVEFRDEIAARASEQSRQLRSARANGQVTTTTVAGQEGQSAKPKSEEEFLRGVFDAVTDAALSRDDRLSAASQLRHTFFGS